MQSGSTVSTQGDLKQFSLFRLLLPVSIGIGVTIFLFYREFKPETFEQFRFTKTIGLYLLLAILCMAGRDFGLSYRFRLMSYPERLSWWQAIRVNWLCEFTSAVTPSAVGGSGLMIFFLRSEGIPAGKGTAITIATLFLDELFFVVAYPLFFLFFTAGELFGVETALIGKLRITFIIVYVLILAWTTILYLALFRHPEYIRDCIRKFFRLSWLRRWQKDGEQLGETLCHSSGEMKSQPPGFWIKAFVLTAFSWIARYLVACALFAPFVPAEAQPVIFARQLILWIVMMISPTPGGSGLSEYTFSVYYADILNSAETMLLIVCCWRIITYYAYLFIGINIVPAWLKRSRTYSEKEIVSKQINS